MLLVDVELFETTIEVVASVIPGIRRPVLIGVRPAVGQVDFAAFRADICKGIKYMSKLVSWDLLRLIVAAIDSPVLRRRLMSVVGS